jgi:hypothetical protein
MLPLVLLLAPIPAGTPTEAIAVSQPSILSSTPWYLALSYAVAGGLISTILGRLLKWRDDLRIEFNALRVSAAAVKMLLSSVENASHQFPILGYDRGVLDRTLNLLLKSDAVSAIEYFDDKFYWRLGYAEQVIALANQYIAMRDEATTREKPRMDVAPDAELLRELRRLHEECRKGLYEALKLLESSAKDSRYRFVRSTAEDIGNGRTPEA